MCSISQNDEEIVLADEILREMRRRIVKSFLDVIVLTKLNEGSPPMGAYDVINFIHQEFGLHYSPDSVNSFLDSWENDGLIKCRHDRVTKAYSLTEKGKKRIKIIMQAKPRILNSILEFLLIEMLSF